LMSEQREGRPPGSASQETCQGTYQVQRSRRTGGERKRASAPGP
jgi:hypothetical protein